MASIEDIRSQLERALNAGHQEEIMRCLRVVSEQGWDLGISYTPASRGTSVMSQSSMQQVRTAPPMVVDVSSEQTVVASLYSPLPDQQIGREPPFYPTTDSSRSLHSVNNFSLDSDRRRAFDFSHSS